VPSPPPTRAGVRGAGTTASAAAVFPDEVRLVATCNPLRRGAVLWLPGAAVLSKRPRLRRLKPVVAPALWPVLLLPGGRETSRERLALCSAAMGLTAPRLSPSLSLAVVRPPVLGAGGVGRESPSSSRTSVDCAACGVAVAASGSLGLGAAAGCCTVFEQVERMPEFSPDMASQGGELRGGVAASVEILGDAEGCGLGLGCRYVARRCQLDVDSRLCLHRSNVVRKHGTYKHPAYRNRP
jgi:hypothetical protein